MEQLSLIVEGEEDVRFLQDFIDFHFAQKIDKNFFIIVGGKSETIHLSSTKIQTSTDSGNERLFKCIDDYATCKSALSLQKSRVIDEKERLRIYHGSFESGSAQGSTRSYLDTVIWDLNSPTLKALREFLTGFFN